MEINHITISCTFEMKIHLKTIMKTLKTIILILAVACTFVACKSHERCPAYGQVITNHK